MIKTDRDNWFSVAETVTRITKDGTPVLREKWVSLGRRRRINVGMGIGDPVLQSRLGK